MTAGSVRVHLSGSVKVHLFRVLSGLENCLPGLGQASWSVSSAAADVFIRQSCWSGLRVGIQNGPTAQECLPVANIRASRLAVPTSGLLGISEDLIHRPLSRV